jgi:hypothetical protein
MTVGLDDATVENVLRPGLLRCPVIGCGERLAPWGWARGRAVRGTGPAAATARQVPRVPTTAGAVTGERAASPGGRGDGDRGVVARSGRRGRAPAGRRAGGKRPSVSVPLAAMKQTPCLIVVNRPRGRDWRGRLACQSSGSRSLAGNRLPISCSSSSKSSLSPEAVSEFEIVRTPKIAGRNLPSSQSLDDRGRTGSGMFS